LRTLTHEGKGGDRLNEPPTSLTTRTHEGKGGDSATTLAEFDKGSSVITDSERKEVVSSDDDTCTTLLLTLKPSEVFATETNKLKVGAKPLKRKSVMSAKFEGVSCFEESYVDSDFKCKKKSKLRHTTRSHGDSVPTQGSREDRVPTQESLREGVPIQGSLVSASSARTNAQDMVSRASGSDVHTGQVTYITDPVVETVGMVFHVVKTLDQTDAAQPCGDPCVVETAEEVLNKSGCSVGETMGRVSDLVAHSTVHVDMSEACLTDRDSAGDRRSAGDLATKDRVIRTMDVIIIEEDEEEEDGKEGNNRGSGKLLESVR